MKLINLALSFPISNFLLYSSTVILNLDQGNVEENEIRVSGEEYALHPRSRKVQWRTEISEGEILLGRHYSATT